MPWTAALGHSGRPVVQYTNDTWFQTIGADESWVALAAWVLTFLGMLHHLYRTLLRPCGDSRRYGQDRTAYLDSQSGGDVRGCYWRAETWSGSVEQAARIRVTLNGCPRCFAETLFSARPPYSWSRTWI